MVGIPFEFVKKRKNDVFKVFFRRFLLSSLNRSVSILKLLSHINTFVHSPKTCRSYLSVIVLVVFATSHWAKCDALRSSGWWTSAAFWRWTTFSCSQFRRRSGFRFAQTSARLHCPRYQPSLLQSWLYYSLIITKFWFYVIDLWYSKLDYLRISLTTTVSKIIPKTDVFCYITW